MTPSLDTRAPTAAHSPTLFVLLACAITWLSALPCALAWRAQRAPTPLAVSLAGLSAFGPLLALWLVRRGIERRPLGLRWRAPVGWLLGALFIPWAVHVGARLLYAGLGGEVSEYVTPPLSPEALAALIVFPLGEEPGWRGYLGPRLAARLGPVRGALALGGIWALWHAGYAITPRGDLALSELGSALVTLPLYSVLIAWALARAGGGLCVALAFHAGAHLDHLERSRDASPGLHACHAAVLAALALLAARDLARRAPTV